MAPESGEMGRVAVADDPVPVEPTVYGGAVQLLAGMWEFVRKNTFGALAFSSYGAFWISYYVFVKFIVGGLTSPADVSVAVGVFLLGWTIFTAYMTVPSD